MGVRVFTVGEYVKESDSGRIGTVEAVLPTKGIVRVGFDTENGHHVLAFLPSELEPASGVEILGDMLTL